MPLLTLALAPQPQVAKLIDSCIAQSRRARSIAVDIATNVRTPTNRSSTSYFLNYVGNGPLLIRIQEPARGKLDRTDRSYWITAGKMVAYDSRANETLSRPLPAASTVLQRATAALGELDAPVQISLSPKVLDAFLSGMRSLPGWAVSARGSKVTISRQSTLAGKRAYTELAFDSQHHLAGFESRAGGTTVDWKFSYHTPRMSTSRVPKDARIVKVFTERERPPKYASHEAERIARSTQNAYGALRSARIDTDGAEGAKHLYWSGARIGESDPSWSWLYDGRTLTIVDKRGAKIMKGPLKSHEILATVAEAGFRVDPLLRDVLLRVAPYSELFPTNATVRIVGAGAVDGKPCDILQVSAPTVRTTAFVRRDNHLFASVGTDSVDRSGHVIASSSIRFHYAKPDGFPKSWGAGRGYAVRRLPKPSAKAGG